MSDALEGVSHPGGLASSNGILPCKGPVPPFEASKRALVVYQPTQVWVSCEVINWRKEECRFPSQLSFLSLHPTANFGQPHGSFILSAENDFQFFQHRAAGSLNLPKTVKTLIMAFQPLRNSIRQLRPGDFHNWKVWVLQGCPGDIVEGTRFGHLYMAIDFEDCLRYVNLVS